VRLLCIGDSVTAGLDAGYNAPYSNSPKRYWEWVTALFAMDKHENDNSGYEFIALGNVVDNSIAKTTFNVDIDGIQINSLTACACGRSSSTTTGWLSQKIVGETINPFYDVEKQKFSLRYWVEKYRTLIVNEDGTTTRCNSENKGELAPEDTTTNNVCEPTHVLIQLGYNQKYAENGGARTKYITELKQIIDTIKEEYPNICILLSLPDTAGTYFPQYFPDYFGDGKDIYPMDFMIGTTKTFHDSISFMNTDLISMADEVNKIFYCPTFFASPSCIGGSHRHVNDFAFYSSKSSAQLYNVQCGTLPTYHPNNAAHASWAYQIYSLIKYTLLRL
ncbi:hypothetical protein, partial [Bacteroides caecigallinarum]|uniref:hypothetical protein n=1 Tax=Bacteroides caecigallinarum TaxID=1411144 RepID=UPI001F245C67